MVREPCCEVFRGINGKFYFRFVSANNRVLAYSRGYRDCKTALRRARDVMEINALKKVSIGSHKS